MSASKKDYVKLEGCPDYMSRMYDEYDEVCNEINDGFVKKMTERFERLTKTISKLSDENSEVSKNMSAMQKSYLLLQHQTMSALIANMRVYERILALRLDYEEYNFKNSQNETKDGE